MHYGMSMAFLLLAALLETGGDGLIRLSIYSTMPSKRVLFLLAGCVVLGAYGYTVNAPRWNFGRLLGVTYPSSFSLPRQLHSLVSVKNREFLQL